MKIELPVGVYANGYSVKHIDCRDIAYAGAASVYEKEGYFQFAFYRSVFSNWSAQQTNQDIVTAALREIGLIDQIEEPNGFNELMELLRVHLGNGEPCIVIVRDRCCFYCEKYLEQHNALHFVLVSGIDDEKKTITLREYMHVRQDISEITRADLLCKLTITVDMFKNIWEKSRETFSCGRLISIRECGSGKTYPDATTALCNCLSKYENKLVELIVKYNDIEQEINVMMEERTTYIGNMTVIFENLEKRYNLSSCDSYSEFKAEYINHRDKMITALHASKMRNQPLSDEKIEEMTRQVQEYDNKLKNLVYSLISR